MITFVDDEITVESLLVMNDETLKAVVPKAGPRAMLLHKLSEVNL